MKTKLYLLGLVMGISISLGSIANAAYIALPANQGGTGTTTPSGILYGDNGSTSHLNTVTIGSNLTFSGGTLSASASGSGTVSTSTIPTVGQLAYWTSNAFPSLLGSVATGTISNGTGISVTAGQSVIGSGLTITNTAPDQTVAFTNGTGISVTGTYPNFTVTNTLPLTFSYLFPSNATSTLIDFSGSIKIGTLAGLIAGNSGNLYAVSTTSMNASITGLAGTATALAANGTNCSAGNYALGVDASGNAEGCTLAAVGTVTGVTGTYPLISSGGATPAISIAFGTTTSNTWANTQTFTNAPIFSSLTGLLKGNGSSALTVAANGTDYTLVTANTCGAGQHFSAATAAGVFTCSADSGGTFSYLYNILTNYATTTAATTTMPWFQEGIYASTTNSVFQGLTIDNALAGDAVTQYGATSHEWVTGAKSSDFTFRISSSTTLGTSDAFTIDKNLKVSLPGSLSIGSLSGLLGASSGLVYSISTSSPLNTSITGNAATVTTNANLTGVVTSSGNTTSFGSQTAGVLGNAVTGNTAPMATSTLYGTGAYGSMLSWDGSKLAFMATTTTFSGTTGQLQYFSATNTLTATSSIFLAASGNVGIASSTPTYLFSVGTAGTQFAINSSGMIMATASQPATSTAMTLDWSATPPQVEYQIGTAATTITLINATTSGMWGSRKLVWVCNPGATAGALTWVGVEWIGTAPTQTTTTNQCDVYSFAITHATSTSAFKVAGSGGTGFK